MVYMARLESVCAANPRAAGSNPVSSAVGWLSGLKHLSRKQKSPSKGDREFDSRSYLHLQKRGRVV